jgi:hypothetical protein
MDHHPKLRRSRFVLNRLRIGKPRVARPNEWPLSGTSSSTPNDKDRDALLQDRSMKREGRVPAEAAIPRRSENSFSWSACDHDNQDALGGNDRPQRGNANSAPDSPTFGHRPIVDINRSLARDARSEYEVG